MSLLERIYSFHSLIQAGHYPNANDLTGEFEISPATAHRDIAYLRDRLLAPLQFDSKKNGYFYTHDNFRLPFEDSPKIVLFLGVLNTMAAEAGLNGLQELSQLKEKLASMMPDNQRRIDDIVHCEWVETEPVNNHVFSTVINSLQQNNRLTFHYMKHHGQTGENRQVDPLKLLNYQGRWYLLGWCWLRRKRRLFHLSKIQMPSLSTLKVSHTMQPDDAYLTGVFGIFKGKSLYTATIHLTGMAAERVRLQQWHPKQKIEELDNNILLHLPVADDRELIMKILQFGDEAEVIAPKILRQRVKNKIKTMAKQYGLPLPGDSQ